MSKLTNFIQSPDFNKIGLSFFTGYLLVSFALGAGIFIIVGAVGFFIFYFLTVGQGKEGKK